MAIKSTPAAECDPFTAFVGANGFKSFARSFLVEAPFDLKERSEFYMENFGRVLAAHTNLALSIELFLKCLAMCLGKPVLHTHNLSELFNALPKLVQQRLESDYTQKEGCLAQSNVGAIEVAITSTPTPPSEDILKAKYVTVTNLRSLLAAEKDAFKDWRYFFQHSPDGAVSIFRAESARLQVFGEVLSEHIRNNRRGKPNEAVFRQYTSGVDIRSSS
jgi:hypothetical protein